MAETLKPGAPLDASSKALLVRLWTSTYEEIGERRFEDAFHKALLNSSYRPDIAEIRRFAGVVTESPEHEARAALKKIIADMRFHGRELRPRRGELLNDGKDPDGRWAEHRQYAPTIPSPVYDPVTHAAIFEMGYGSGIEGLAAIACHPAVPRREFEEPVNPNFRERQSREVETRWIAAYLLCKSRKPSSGETNV